MRSEKPIKKYDKDSLELILSTMLISDYRSDARIDIKALEIIGRLNGWDDESVRTARSRPMWKWKAKH
ncbi:MAG: hypothetical protein ACYCSO_07280 [Cuniculiplasma sp.]